MEQRVRMEPSGLNGYRYEPRPIRFLGAGEAKAGWRVKRYVITAPRHGGVLPEAATTASEAALHEALPAGRRDGEAHGVAILTTHLGVQGLWVLVDWWASGDILMHRHHHAPVDSPAELRDVSGQGFGPCVWELAVQAHEREAWLRHVLAAPAGPDLPAYLADGLTASV